MPPAGMPIFKTTTEPISVANDRRPIACLRSLLAPPSVFAHAPSLQQQRTIGASHRRLIFGRYRVDGPTTNTDSKQDRREEDPMACTADWALRRATSGDGIAT